jgi:hypothetical protein
VSDVTIQHASRSGPHVALRVLAAALVSLALLVAIALYVRVGWWRMQSACSLENARGTIHNSVTYGWSWNPIGFQCTYNNGQTQTSLWP